MTSGPRPPVPRHVPTLTEVLDTEPLDSHAGTGAPMSASDSHEELVRRVLGELHRHFDDTLEPRLRAAVAPVVDAVADALLAEARAMLDELLLQAVREAVAKELTHSRESPPR